MHKAVPNEEAGNGNRAGELRRLPYVRNLTYTLITRCRSIAVNLDARPNLLALPVLLLAGADQAL